MSSQNPSQTYPMPSPSVSTFTFPSTTEPVFTASTSEPVFESPNHTQTSQTTQSQQLQQYHTTTVSNNNAKFPYLKKEEYETWAMKMEYWIMNSDHNLWNIVLNGNSRKRTGRDPKGNIMILPPVSVEEHIAVQRETKARTILLQSLPEDHMADFHHLDDARDIWLAVKARFGGNDESKKMRKSMLKQEFSEFRVSESEGLHKGYDRIFVLVEDDPDHTLMIRVKGIKGHDFLANENPHKNRDLGIIDSDGKITGKGTIRTSKLNFENVYYVEELQNFNLFSVSQICDTKNKVLFTDKECLVLSKEFQPPENSQVVLRVPRRNNLYCFNLSDIKPERDVTCLLAKASLVCIKKIFKYLKGQPKLGLWYPRDSPFVLEAYNDSDYASSHGDRKSTTGGCQFLGRRLISWQCKNKPIVEYYSTEAE
ncbi:hypothetical protein Tco_0908568 [Tanacetum coccineum]|uniref:Uncharacterized protein n=1 Tax=Tanacetum coccineum TaxID=301880 RepID=A0ABQ5CPP1_9ASTR